MVSVIMFSTRVYYQDTDAGGVVYFANYLKFIEKSWFEYLLSIGISLAEWQARNTYVIIKNVNLDLIEPLRYADVVFVDTTITEVKHAFFVLSHVLIRNERIVARCQTKMVSIDNGGRPKRMPEEFRDILLQNSKTGTRMEPGTRLTKPNL